MATTTPSRPNSEVEAIVRQYVADWASFLGVSHQWHVHLAFLKGEDMESTTSKAECAWPTSYTTATIKFNIDQWEKNPCDCELEETVVHEVMHLVDAQTWDWADANLTGTTRTGLTELLERQTDIFTRIAIRGRYGDDYRCSRCSQLHDSDDARPDDASKVVWSAPSYSGRDVRLSSTTPATGGGSSLNGDGSIRLADDPIFCDQYS